MQICLIYNFAHHYRYGIFKLMDERLPMDFIFGDKYLDIKKIDYKNLYHFKQEVKNKIFIKKPFYYQKGVIKLLFENYTSYIILGETICVSTWLILILSKFSRKKIFLWSHGWYGKETLIEKTLKKIFFHLADEIFLYGNYAKSLMIKNGIRKEKLHVIYNSLDYQTQKKIRDKIKETKIFKNHFQNNNKNLIFIGRLTSVKKLDQLILALKILKNDQKYYNLTIIGSGENETMLKELVNDQKLSSQVWFFGPSYNENQISEFIYNSDLCVSPGNVGLTAIHSMTYGTPVITHNDFKTQMPEFEAIIKSKTGAFFEKDNCSSLANEINFWFKLGINRDEIRNNCFNIVDTYYNPEYQFNIFKNILY